jgi:hypothetical protein
LKVGSTEQNLPALVHLEHPAGNFEGASHASWMRLDVFKPSFRGIEGLLSSGGNGRTPQNLISGLAS